MPALRRSAIALTMNAGQNFASSSLVAIGYRSGFRMFEPARTRIALISVRVDVVLRHEPAHRVHRRMAEHAARIRLDRDAGRDDRVRPPKDGNDPRGIVALTVAERLEEAPRRIERVLAAGKAARRELSGRDAV